MSQTQKHEQRPAYQIVPATAELAPSVREFNERMRAGGSRWQFYEQAVPNWLPHEPDATVWRENYLMLDQASGKVVGGYVLKSEAFLFDGKPVCVAHQQGPVAESVVDPRLRGLGFKMVSDSLDRRPFQLGWGATIRQGWPGTTRPAMLYIVDKTRFVRNAKALRRNRALAAVLDLASYSGAPQAALALAQAGLALRGRAGRRFEAAEEEAFGPWADEVWEHAKGHYRLIAVRDAKTLNRLMPRGQWPDGVPLRVTVDGTTVGWAALRVTQLENDPLFGSLRSGSILDALAKPGFERTVVAAATQALRRRKVDFVGAIFSHADWIRALSHCGYLLVKDRRGVGFSPALAQAGGGLEPLLQGTHLTLVDADGPHIF